jgi:hypothetical protein
MSRLAALAAVLAFGIFTVSCSRAGDGSSLPTATPLIADLRRFCLDTGAIPSEVSKAADRAGARLNVKGDNGETAQSAWTHTVDGHTIFLASSFADRPVGPAILDLCTLRDPGDWRASPKILLGWLGVSESDGLMQSNAFMLKDGRPQVINESNIPKDLKNNPSVMIFRLDISSLDDETMLLLTRYR